MTNNYSVHLVWSAEDSAFVASVTELPGCMADGATRESACSALSRVALQALDQVIEEWIETANEIGRPVPTPLIRESVEQIDKSFQERLALHVRREVEAAVQRVITEMSVDTAFVGGVDPAENWKQSAGGQAL